MHVNPECATCEFRDRPILVVGSQRFSVEIFANYIAANTPAKWEVFDRLEQIPPPVEKNAASWRLIFIDCQDFSDSEIQKLFKTEAKRFGAADIIALFNLSPDNRGLVDLMHLGVRGFFFRHDRAEIILKGICALKKGEMWIPRKTLISFVDQQPKSLSPADQMLSGLTKREKEILSLLAMGETNEAIGSQLYISQYTVKSHVYNILKKLGVQSRVQAALWANRNLH